MMKFPTKNLYFIFFFQIAEYKSSQDTAKKSHLNMWQYGDITEDDAKEFGLGN